MDKKLLNEDIQNIKYLFGYKPGRVISEQDINYTPEMDEDLEFEEKETTESILEKHNLLDEVKLVRDNTIMFENKSSEVIEKFLSILNLFSEVQILAIVHCEYADFSNVDICSLPQIMFINLTGTDNNFEEQGYECVDPDISQPPLYYIE
jgi:hypothetical protein